MHLFNSFSPLLFGSTAQEKRDLGFDEASLKQLAEHCGTETEEKNNLFAPASDDEIFCGYGREEGNEGFDLELFKAGDRATTDNRERVRRELESRTQGAFATRRLLERLAHRMTKTMKKAWEWQDAPGSRDNENLPAGYTYLAQFVAHDLVANLAPLPGPDASTPSAQRDFRSERLILDTLYGGGPAAGSLPFARRDDGGRQRIKLRLGRVYAPEARVDGKGGRGFDTDNNPLPRFEDGILDENQPARDIPRTSCPFLNDKTSKGFTDPLIADPRNDDNLILSQLTALFHELHNIVVDKLVPEGARMTDFEACRKFVLCRKVVAFVYRQIIVHDLLSRLLDSKIYDRYLKKYNADLARSGDVCADQLCDNPNRVPVEFSHAVFRFAHAMVRNDYVLNDQQARIVANGGMAPTIADVLNRTSACHASMTPLSCDWLVDWKYFFETETVPPKSFNLSRRIIPDVGAGGLAGNLHFPNEHGPNAEGGGVPSGGLFYRDLIRGAEVRVSKIERLLDHLPSEDKNRSPILHSPNIRKKKIERWLNGVKFTRFEDGDAEAIANDPPLFFFTLFEAAQDKQGMRLGILGSTITAKVFFAALRRSINLIERDPVVQAEVAKVFEQNVPQTMPDLINFIKGAGGLQDVECKPVPARKRNR